MRIEKLLALVTLLYFISSATSIAGIAICITLMLPLIIADYFKGSYSLKEFFKYDGNLLVWSFAAVTFLSLLVNWSNGPELRESFVDIRWIVSIYLIAWGLSNFFKEEKYFRFFSIILIALSIYSIFQSLTGFDIKGENPHLSGSIWRSRGLFSNPIRFANVIGTLSMILFPLAISETKNKKGYLYTLAFLGCFLSTIFSLTRGAWVALIVTTLALIFIYKRNLLFKAFGAFALLFASAYFFSSSFQDRIHSVLNIERLKSEGRIVIWQLHSEVFLENPWIGTGAGTSGPEAVKKATTKQLVHPVQTHAHNQLLDILVTRGIFGGIIFVLIIICFIKQGLKLSRDNKLSNFQRALALGAVGGIFYLAICGITESNIESNETANIFALCISLIVYISRLRSNSSKKV